MKLGILEQSPIASGQTAQEALLNTIELAEYAEKWGYERFWVAEHHNTNGLAISSPEIMMTMVASKTKTIRVGSGGVLLPQYSPYKVAENFKTLMNLFPNRIDIGIGRSPGGGPDTRLALTDGIPKSLNMYPQQVRDLRSFLYTHATKQSDYQTVHAYPDTNEQPLLWNLGVSHRGARFAAENSLAFTYGHFINPLEGKRAMDLYIEEFQPTETMPKPIANVCVFAVCAETEEEATRLAATQEHWLLRLEEKGNHTVPSLNEIASISLTDKQKEKKARNKKRMIVGTPSSVKKQLETLAETYQTDEFLLVCNIHNQEKKQASFRLIAEAVL